MIGATRIGSPLLRAWLARGVPVCFLNRNGRLQGYFAPYKESDPWVKIRQFDACGRGVWPLRQARLLAHAKLRNSRRVLQRVRASRKELDESAGREVARSVRRLHDMALNVVKAGTPDEVRGCEGLGAAAYFRGFRALVPEPFRFDGRNRRPPRDPVNALLSLTYAMLVQELRSYVVCAGLEPSLGVLHQPAHGRPALALDLMEPYRAPVGDMLVLRLLGLGVCKPEHFEIDPETGGTRLEEEAAHRYFRHYEQRMERWFKTRQGGEHTTIRALLRGAVDDFKQALRADDDLRPYLMP